MQMIYCPKCASEDIDIKRKSSEEYLSEGISFNNIFEIVLIVLMGIEVIAYIPELVFGSWVFITMWKSADIFSKISLSMIYALMGVFLGASFLFIIKYMRIILLKIHINHIRSEFPDNIYVCKNCLFTWQ